MFNLNISNKEVLKAKERKEKHHGKRNAGNQQTTIQPLEVEVLTELPGEYLCKYSQRGQGTVPTLNIYYLDVSKEKNSINLQIVSENKGNGDIKKVTVSIPTDTSSKNLISLDNIRDLTVQSVFAHLFSSLFALLGESKTMRQVYRNLYHSNLISFNKIPNYFKNVNNYFLSLSSKDKNNNNNENSNENNNNNNENNNENNDDDNDVDNDDDNDIDQDIEIN